MFELKHFKATLRDGTVLNTWSIRPMSCAWALVDEEKNVFRSGFAWSREGACEALLKAKHWCESRGYSKRLSIEIVEAREDGCM